MTPSPDRILLIIERDSYQKDADLMRRLVDAVCLRTGRRPVWYNPHGVGSSQVIVSRPGINALPKVVRYAIKAFALLRYPGRLRNYLSPDAWREATIEGRCKNLKQYIRRLGPSSDIAVLARSAGGRVASLVADDAGIKKIVCLGYPFKHPDHPVEPERYEHLASLMAPMLIIQGTRDEYGGADAAMSYDLSPAISVEAVETDHDFAVSPEQFSQVVSRIVEFLGGALV